jgi:hypothetical protein
VLLGDDLELLPWLVLALGAAMALGSVLALVRPPAQRREGDLERPPVLRSVVFALIGLVAAFWAVGSLVAS